MASARSAYPAEQTPGHCRRSGSELRPPRRTKYQLLLERSTGLAVGRLPDARTHDPPCHARDRWSRRLDTPRTATPARDPQGAEIDERTKVAVLPKLKPRNLRTLGLATGLLALLTLSLRRLARNCSIPARRPVGCAHRCCSHRRSARSDGRASPVPCPRRPASSSTAAARGLLGRKT
jgi:hypothetical protein